MDHRALHRTVENYYASVVPKEWRRLDEKGSISWLEHYTTMQYLRRYLPKRGRVLDGGSGPGRYTIELAKAGYKMTALDPVRESLRFAEKASKRKGVSRNIEGFVKGRIENLSQFDSNSFDAVMSLGGPLSHVMSAKLRKRAASELVRVAKPGAPVFASVMGRLSTISGLLMEFPEELEEAYVPTWIQKGDYKGKVFGKPVFTAFHGFMPDELAGLFRFGNFKRISTVALEGFASRAQPQLRKLSRNKKLFGIWLKLHMELCEEPSILGISNHILLVGRKI